MLSLVVMVFRLFTFTDVIQYRGYPAFSGQQLLIVDGRGECRVKSIGFEK